MVQCQHYRFEKGRRCRKEATRTLRKKETGKEVNFCDDHAEKRMDPDGGDWGYEEVK